MTDELTQNLDEALENFIGEHTINLLAYTLHKFLEEFGTRALISELKKLI